MNRPFRRELGRALDFTRAGRLADARESLRRLARADDRERWTLRRERAEVRAAQLALPLVVEDREGGGTPHTGRVLCRPAGPAGAGERDIPPDSEPRMFPR